MKKLLVIADRMQESQKAFGKALKLAGKTGADIHVAIFLYEPEEVLSAMSEQSSEFDGDELKSLMIDRKTQWWQEYIHTHRGELEITYKVVWYKYIHDWVIKHIEKHQYDLVIKTGHRSENLFYTPTDWQLFRDSTAPVYIVANKQFKPKKVVLVSLDMLAKSDKKKNLNRQLLECANRMALQTDAVLHCVFVVNAPTILTDLDLIDRETYVRKARTQAQANLPSLIENYTIAPECIHIEEGLPWGVISNLTKKLRAQCLVVGSMGRKGIAGKLVGNTAEKIIRIANTDLLVISPKVKVV